MLITGTNSGFGWLTVKSVAALGHKVYATMRDTNGKNADKASALSEIENVTVLDMELTDEASVKNAVDKLVAEAGTIDVLVNNAGIAMFGVAESATTADVQRILDVNFIAPWRLMKFVLPMMRKNSEGLIVNITSGSGRFSVPFSAVYGASKFALEGLSEGLSYELKASGVDVAIVQPGSFPTEMAQKLQAGSDSSVIGEYDNLADVQTSMFTAIGQMFEKVDPNPQDVADAVVNLINMPQGQRPLRTVVDPNTGKFVEKANAAVETEYENVLKAFGLGKLLDLQQDNVNTFN